MFSFVETMDDACDICIYARANVFHLRMYLYYGCYLIDGSHRYLVFFLLLLDLYLGLLSLLTDSAEIKKYIGNDNICCPLNLHHATFGIRSGVGTSTFQY